MSKTTIKTTVSDFYKDVPYNYIKKRAIYSPTKYTGAADIVYERVVEIAGSKIDLQELQANNAPVELFKGRGFEEAFGDVINMEDEDVRLQRYCQQLAVIDPGFNFSDFVAYVEKTIDPVVEKMEDKSVKDEDKKDIDGDNNKKEDSSK